MSVVDCNYYGVKTPTVYYDDLESLLSEININGYRYLYFNNKSIKEVKLLKRLNYKYYITKLLNNIIKYLTSTTKSYPEQKYKLNMAIKCRDRIKGLINEYQYIQRIKIKYEDKTSEVLEVLIDKNNKIYFWDQLFGGAAIMFLQNTHFVSRIRKRVPQFYSIQNRLQKLYNSTEPCIINCNAKSLTESVYNLDKNFIESLAVDLGIQLRK